jgi:RNA polymerase-binding transcription factor DksA
MAVELKARQQQLLLRVQNALDAIPKGTYGQCRRCKGGIAIERLEANQMRCSASFARKSCETLSEAERTGRKECNSLPR